jgi:hypothetical protein
LPARTTASLGHARRRSAGTFFSQAESRPCFTACAEEPLLIAKILGHDQQLEELNGALARAPPGHQEQTFNLI